MTSAFSPFRRPKDRRPRLGGCRLLGGRTRVPPLAAPSLSVGERRGWLRPSLAVGSVGSSASCRMTGQVAAQPPNPSLVAAPFSAGEGGGHLTISDFWGGNEVQAKVLCLLAGQ
uniref:Uncharacterized protein n=1 Tax=Setaria viridis TaxID=4556 RepID=A0A4U6V6V2_SETVI|nr:hypothetical protein SEVIR_3G022400v2 [Setaria viridis]